MTGGYMEKWINRAHRYRDRADVMRAIAANIRDPAAATSLREVAHEYDVMAKHAEDAARHEKQKHCLAS
jgi:hypothetical protein